MKERWFNYRPLCLIFGFLLLGSVFAFFTPNNTFLCIAVMTVIFLALTALAIYKKKPQYVLVPIVAFVVGVFCYLLAINDFNKTINFTPKTIQARIYNISDEKDGMLKVEADSCIFDGKKNNDNIIVYLYDNSGLFENIEVGSIIEFQPNKFYKSDLFYYETPSSSLYSNDLKYTTSVLMENIKHIKTDKTFAEIIKDKVKNNLSLGLTNENTEIAYSAFFGDKDLLSDKQYNVYKLSGVAHLLAVSGLHVGIIVHILKKISNFHKKRRWWKCGIITAALLFYMYMCNYSISIVRASIMSIILLLATMLGKEYDTFNSISVAGIIIYLINPLCIFDVAFLLSFSCVIGITMLYTPIQKALQKTKISEKFINSVAMSMATTTAIVVIMAYYFRTLNIISIIANVILIPIFTLAFSIVFVISILSLLIPYLCYLIYPVNYIFDFINITANILGNLAISNFNTLKINYISIIIYFILLLFAGRFCTAKYQYKLISTLPILALLFHCLL